VSEEPGADIELDAAQATRSRRGWRVANPWASLRGLPREIWVLCLATLVNRVGTMALLFLVLYLTARGWTARDAGLLVSAYGVGSVIASPLGGRLSDRIGAHRVVLGSLVFAGAILILYPLVDGRVAIFAVTMLWSLTAEAYRPASFTLVSHAARPEQRRAAFAAHRAAVNIGASLGPALGGFLARVAMPALFVVDGLTSLAAAAVLWFANRGREKHTGAIAPADVTTEETRETGAPHAGRLGLLADRRFVRLLIGVLLLATVFFQVVSTLALDLVRGQGMSESSLGLLYALNAVLVVLFEIPLSVRLGAWPAPRALGLGALFISAGIGATAFAHDFLTAAVTVVVWSVGEMLVFPSGSSYVSEITSAARRGEAMGLYTAAFGAGFILAPLLGTWALGRWGADVTWASAFALGCVAATMLVRLDAPAREVVPSAA